MDFNTLYEPEPFADFWRAGGQSFGGGDARSVISNLATQALHAKGHREPGNEAEDGILAPGSPARQTLQPGYSPAGPGESASSPDLAQQQQLEQQIAESDAAPVFRRPESPLNGNPFSAYEETTARAGGEDQPEPDQNSADAAETGAAGEDVTADGNAVDDNPSDSNAPESNEAENPQPVALHPTPPSSETHSANVIEPAHEDREQMEADADYGEPQEDAPTADHDDQATLEALDGAESVARLPSIGSPAGEPEPDAMAKEEFLLDVQIYEQITANTVDESHASQQPVKRRHRRSAVELLEEASRKIIKGGSLDRRSRRVSAPETVVLQKNSNARGGKGSLLSVQAATQTPGRRGRPRKSETPKVLFASALKQLRVTKTSARSTPMRAKMDVMRSAGKASGVESTPATMKRGRPPKGQVAESTPATVKRGRPPKGQVAESTSATVKRGRPAKGRVAEPTPASGKRGRPAKVEAVATLVTPKRRGRPPKSAAPPSPAKPIIPALPKKSPGRPRKVVTTTSEAPIKRSGRVVPVTAPTQKTRARSARQAAAPAPPKVTFSAVKRQGRSSRNATTTVDSSKPGGPNTRRGLRSQPNESGSKSAPTEPKRTKGRLAKPTVDKSASQSTEDKANSTPAKKRGRPKATAVNNMTTQRVGESGSTAVKRRGRPAKLAAVDDIAPRSTENEPDSSSVKRGKRATSTANKMASKPSENEANPTPAKKRGRPARSTAIPDVPVSTEPPKKRGRARRVEVETPEEPEAKRRRTRTSTADNDSAVTGEPSSGRRGRSQKADTSLTTAEAPPAQSSATTPRGRGRKPAGEEKLSEVAVQPPPRPRGRPAKSSGAGKVETPKVDSGAKPRGRPRGDATAQGALAKAAHPKGVGKAKKLVAGVRGAVAQRRRSLRSAA